MPITPEQILAVRRTIGDTAIELPILADDEYTYILEKNKESIKKSALDAARTILLKLSMRGYDRETDVLSIKGGARAAEQYRLALQMWLRDPTLNPISAGCWVGGVSKSEIKSRVQDVDTNAIVPVMSKSAHDLPVNAPDGYNLFYSQVP